MNNTTTTATTIEELLADADTCAWLDSIEDAGDAGIYEDLHTLRYVTDTLSITLATTLQDLYQSDIFTEGK
jgi:hypothetical protein